MSLLVALLALAPLGANAQPKSLLDVIAEGEQDNRPEAVQQRAEAGDGAAMLALGSMYYLGHPFGQDRDRAMALYEKAAKKGISEAAYRRARLGHQHDSLTWLRMAAEQGHVQAQFELARAHNFGQAGAQNFHEAAKWYGLAAKQGSPDALYHLGMLYRFGQGVPQDYKAAFALFSTAAEKGHKDARFEFGRCFAQGQGTQQDYKAAYTIFRSLAVEQHLEGLDQMALFYLEGMAVRQNRIAAYALYNFMATKFEHSSSAARREKVKSQLTRDDVERAQQLTWELLKATDVMSAVDKFTQQPSSQSKRVPM